MNRPSMAGAEVHRAGQKRTFSTCGPYRSSYAYTCKLFVSETADIRRAEKRMRGECPRIPPNYFVKCSATCF